MISNKIKLLREAHHLTQAALAKKLGITRSSVNAWEMGLSVPSTQYIVKLSSIFKVSTDFLLGVHTTTSISVEGLSDREVALISELISCFRKRPLSDDMDD